MCLQNERRGRIPLGTFSHLLIAADRAAPQACSGAECPAVTVGTTWVCLGLWGDALGKAFLNSPGSHSGLFDSHFGAYNRGIQSVTKSSLYAIPCFCFVILFVMMLGIKSRALNIPCTHP